MTDEEFAEIRKRNEDQKRDHLRNICDAWLDGGSCCGQTDDIDTLLAEIARLKASPYCPGCGHRVTNHHGGYDSVVFCLESDACLCEDWVVRP